MKLYLLPMLLAENAHDRSLTPYSIQILKSLKVFFVENVKTTRRFLSSLKQGVVIDELRFIEMDQPFERYLEILANLGEDAGIISEAGCAGVADPGALVVEAGQQMGWTVQPLVGPNSILLALMGSGLNGQSFAFHGYLPIKAEDRASKLKQLEREGAQKSQTQIFMETPYRNNKMAEDIIRSCKATTELCIAANLTCEDEYIKTKSIKEWTGKLPDLSKKPTIFLIYK